MTRTEQNIALVSIILASAALPRSAICSKQPKGRVLLDGLYFPVQHGSKESCHAANLSVCCPGAVIWSCPLPHEPAERSFCCHVRHDCAYCCAEHEFFGQHDPAHCRDTPTQLLTFALGAMLMFLICVLVCCALVPGGVIYRRMFPEI
ncbi:uncharacterized protein LOC119110582 isoform X2 [Pollicipes pollicipes]|uniref:uncharacterized protein LOC119110582 isoform X2 n=1 Tax=Pollicipes pollicipes TaxID=41117 RepID=UPI001884DA20|nr:uncharacterized protein LOC119110582 isoform X2 [Pollicipes pollicipes]